MLAAVSVLGAVVSRRGTGRVGLVEAFTDPGLPVGQMIPVRYATVPPAWRRDARALIRDEGVSRPAGRRARTGWLEVCGPLASQGGCRFGCKLYVRRRGAVIEFAVFHCLAYGHSHSPDSR